MLEAKSPDCAAPTALVRVWISHPGLTPGAPLRRPAGADVRDGESRWHPHDSHAQRRCVGALEGWREAYNCGGRVARGRDDGQQTDCEDFAGDRFPAAD